MATVAVPGDGRVVGVMAAMSVEGVVTKVVPMVEGVREAAVVVEEMVAVAREAGLWVGLQEAEAKAGEAMEMDWEVGAMEEV